MRRTRRGPDVRCQLGLVALLACLAPLGVGAIKLRLSRADVDRALALARWTHTDAERAQFHKRYTVPVNNPPIDAWIVEQIEVVTEFRRVELMAEEHLRINDSWGRGDLSDVDKSLQPWRGRVSVIARLALRTDKPYIGRSPVADIVVDDDAVAGMDVHRRDVLAACNGDLTRCPVVGGVVEAQFEAAALGQRTRTVAVVWDGKTLARAAVNFADLE